MKKFKFTFLAAAAILVSGQSLYAQGIISTIAGNGIGGYSGDGGPALIAQFSDPMGVALDPAGNIYIADHNNYRVRVINATTGVISTFAGTGTFGLAGLGGPASVATIKLPDAVYCDALGNVFITDWYNDMEMRVNTAGIIMSECGDGGQGGNGDGGQSDLARMEIPAGACSDAMGNVYIADNGNNRIRMTSASPLSTFRVVNTIANNSGAHGFFGDGGPASLAKFNGVSSVFCDPAASPNLYISDAGNHVIRKIDLESGIITTIAGTPGVPGHTGDGGDARLATLSNPGNMFIDGHHNLYLCDRGNNAIRKINLSTGTISTIAGTGYMGFSGDGGISSSAQLNDPEGVWGDAAGNLYIADAGNQRIRQISAPIPVSSGPTVTPVDVSAIGTGTESHTGIAGLGINTVQALAVAVFPNPSNGELVLQAPDAKSNGSIEIYNVTGEKVYSAMATENKTVISLAGQPSGVYTLYLKSAAGVDVVKISVSR